MTTSNHVDKERLARLKAARANYPTDAAELISELRRHGFAIDGIGELYNRKLAYKPAIPLLLAWLPKVDNPVVKEEVVRALAVKWAKGTSAPALLIEEFKADDPTGTLRWAIGNALEVLATAEFEEELVRIATDQNYGKAREMVVLGLGNIKTSTVVGALVDLLADEEVVGHAIMALGKLRAREARAYIEPLASHPKSWVRKEAKKALARIDAELKQGPSAI